jgi:hypothetical protein
MAYEPFNMKKPSTTQGTAKHTEKLQDKYYQELRVSRELDKNMPDGRSMSSPFQQSFDPSMLQGMMKGGGGEGGGMMGGGSKEEDGGTWSSKDR